MELYPQALDFTVVAFVADVACAGGELPTALPSEALGKELR